MYGLQWLSSNLELGFMQNKAMFAAQHADILESHVTLNHKLVPQAGSHNLVS